MNLWSDSFSDGGRIPARCAFGAIDPATHVRLSDNLNPHLAWDGVPAGTQSLALFCIDIDAPSVGSDVNQEGRSVPRSLARVEFYHWSLIDLALAQKSIAEGAASSGVTAHGKSGPEFNGQRHGLNDYTGWFAADADMAGKYFGYDGPCPPWNDERVHRYIFRIYALDVARLELDGNFTGAQAMQAVRGHILDEAQILGVYALNPTVAASLAD